MFIKSLKTCVYGCKNKVIELEKRTNFNISVRQIKLGIKLD